jgi:hypothetical protein
MKRYAATIAALVGCWGAVKALEKLSKFFLDARQILAAFLCL